jgi:hypothetical protein
MPAGRKSSNIIWGQCAAKCCICKAELVYEQNGKVSSLIGEVAHIVGEAKDAARGDSDMSLVARNAAANFLLLCRQHHKIVDDDTETYTVNRLHQIKEAHLAWIAKSLIKPRPWKSTISQLTYINVPRLCEQAELQGCGVDLSRYRENEVLSSLGWELNHVMDQFRGVLAHLSIDAVTIPELVLHEEFIGSPLAFERQRFRTRNIRFKQGAALESLPQFTGDLSRDPHIYAQLSDFRVVLFIEPRWITTTTAFVLFRPSSGQSTFSGLGRITGVDYDTKIMTVTPWVIGLPKSPLEGFLASRTRNERNLSLDSLVDLERAQSHAVYFSPSPTHCDLCHRKLEEQRFMIDGRVKGRGIWACMCEECFHERGHKIGWGNGQLFLKDEHGWLEVAGFRPKNEESDS